MTGSSSDAPVELRFKRTRRSLFGGLLPFTLAFTVIAVLAWGAVAWSAWGGHLGILTGLFIGLSYTVFGVLFTLAALFLWGLMAFGPAKMWRIWGQHRRPDAVVDASGIRFETRRGPIGVPWEDVEQFILSHVTREPTPTSRLRLRVTPDAVILHEARVRIPAHRWLIVALLPKNVEVSVDEATRILRSLSGSRLEVVDEQKMMDES